jgi:hypothetical protein
MADPELARALAILREPATIRARSHALLDRAVANHSRYFTVHLDRLRDAAAYVADVIREAYPSLDIPYHARWRHFAAGGRDRWGALAAELNGVLPAEIARIRIDLCVVSVLLDAGAGAEWRFVEPGTGDVLSRSEGLAVASLHAFRNGLFSGVSGEPFRVDAAGLACLSPEVLARTFQARPDNMLEGLEGRLALLRSLAQVLAERTDLFGSDGRVGRLFDLFLGGDGSLLHPRSDPGTPRSVIAGLDPASASVSPPPPSETANAVPAAAILAVMLDAFGPIWPNRLTLDGESLGDVWHHPAIQTPDKTTGLIPFHKLSQWLTYSLVEILEDAGQHVTGLDALTGLPEYRNGGLFLDLGVLFLRDPALAAQALPVSHEAIVEWRALTVALLDRIADPIRGLLGRTAEELPLARILEGGTWAAGRRTARERRPGGVPPLKVLSDGTVF